MTEETTARQASRWPLVLMGLPAAVAIWSGWVGLGVMCGFGLIHPLPGIWDAAKLNTAITLPVGMEAYAAYALGVWLRPGAPARARNFAKVSVCGSLLLGMTGQVAYHLLAAAHVRMAPAGVTVVVSCVPVVALGLAATLAHLMRAGSGDSPEQSSGHEWRDLVSPVAAAVAARIAPSRGTLESSSQGTVQCTAEGSLQGSPGGTLQGITQGIPEGTFGDTFQGTPGGAVQCTPEGTVQCTPEGTPRGTRKAPADRSEWPSARGIDHDELVRRTRAAVRAWERTHEPGDRLPAAQLASKLRLRMNRDTAGKLLAEVYGPPKLRAVSG